MPDNCLFLRPNVQVEPLFDQWYAWSHLISPAQSLMFGITDRDDRSFVLSTPRLGRNDRFQLQVPLRDERLGWLFRSKTSAVSWGEVQDKFDIPSESQELFKSLFTEEVLSPGSRYRGHHVRWRYFGHACILIETRDTAILIDPVVSYSYPSETSRYTYADLPDSIDYVLLTHNHQDHVVLEALIQLRSKIKNLIVPSNSVGTLQDPSLKLMFNKIGFGNVIELPEFDTVDLLNGQIMGLPFFGEHCDLAINTKLAYFVRLGEQGFLFAADSCGIEPGLYQHIHDMVGDIEVLFLGMECDGAPLTWLYGPLMSRRIERAMDESRRLSGSNFEQAVDVVTDSNCRQVYVYAMGQEPWLNLILRLKYTDESRPIIESNRLIAECRRSGVWA